MALAPLLNFVPVFALVTFRLGGFMLFAPLFGSARIPKRVRALFAAVLAMVLTAAVPRPTRLPSSMIELAIGIGGEIAFGYAMGMVMSFVFVAAQWAGEMMGVQMGFNLAETFDPQFGQSSSVLGDIHYMLTLVVFLAVNGHHSMIRGIRDSFRTLPLLSVGVDASVLDLVIRMFQTSTMLAIRIAAPVLITLLIVDLTLGFLGKTIPQLNVLAMGQSLKSMVGLLVLFMGMLFYTTPAVLRAGVEQSMQTVRLVLAGSH